MNLMTPTRPVKNAIPDAWINRPAEQTFRSLNELFDFTQMEADASRASNIQANQIVLQTDADFLDPTSLVRMALQLPDGQVVQPNHYSFGQMCQLIGAPAGHYRDLPAPIGVYGLQYKLNTFASELVKAYVRRDTGELRALTSPTYGRVHDYKVVDAMRQIAGNGNGDTRWVSATMLHGREPAFFASDRDMFMFLVDRDNPIVVGRDPNGNDDVMFRGVFAWNSEVGSRSMGIKEFLFRSYCDNRLVFGTQYVEETVIRHTKNAPQKFLEVVRPALELYANADASSTVRSIHSAMASVVAKDDEAAVMLLNRKTDLSIAAAKKALELHMLEERKPARSAWDMAQAVTAYARSVPHQAERVKLESDGGKLLALAA